VAAHVSTATPARHVSVAGIFELYGRSLAKARELLDHLLAQPLPVPEPAIRGSLQSAMLTPDDALAPEQLAWLAVLRQ
jgi:5'-methylthioadenosine phosphorylase